MKAGGIGLTALRQAYMHAVRCGGPATGTLMLFVPVDDACNVHRLDMSYDEARDLADLIRRLLGDDIDDTP